MQPQQSSQPQPSPVSTQPQQPAGEPALKTEYVQDIAVRQPAPGGNPMTAPPAPAPAKNEDHKLDQILHEVAQAVRGNESKPEQSLPPKQPIAQAAAKPKPPAKTGSSHVPMAAVTAAIVAVLLAVAAVATFK